MHQINQWNREAHMIDASNHIIKNPMVMWLMDWITKSNAMSCDYHDQIIEWWCWCQWTKSISMKMWLMDQISNQIAMQIWLMHQIDESNQDAEVSNGSNHQINLRFRCDWCNKLPNWIQFYLIDASNHQKECQCWCDWWIDDWSALDNFAWVRAFVCQARRAAPPSFVMRKVVSQCFATGALGAAFSSLS